MPEEKFEGLAGFLTSEEKPWIQIAAQMHDHSMTVAGVPAKKFYYDAKCLIETSVDVANYYNMDTCAAFADAYNFEIEALGGKMIYGEHSMPTIDFRDPLIKSPEDLSKLKKKEVDWYNDGRLPYALESINMNMEYGTVQGIFCGPFSMAVGMCTFPRLIKFMRKQPEFAHEIYTFITDDVLEPYLKAQNDYSGIMMAIGADAWACIPNLSIKDMQEWVLPYNKRIMENAKKFGVMAMNISGDYCEERLEKFDKKILHDSFDIEVASQGDIPSLFLGMGRWHEYPLEAVLDYTAKYREQGIKPSVAAGLNGRVLRDGPAEKIVDNVKRFIKTFAKDHNLTVFLANIPADAPPEHIHAAIAATHTYGHFPIADNLDDVDFKMPTRESFKEWKAKNS